jgi:hypothetical protein
MASWATQILRAPENIFYQAIQRSQVTWVGAAWTGVNVALAYGQTVSPYFSRNLDLNRIFSTAINAGWILGDLAMLSEEITVIRGSGVFLSTLAGSIFLNFAGTWLYKKGDPLESFSESAKSFSITVNHTSRKWQSWDQTLVLSRALMNLVIACLSPQYRLWAGFNAIGLGYSYLKNAQIKWLKLSWKHDFPALDPAELLELTKNNPKKYYGKALQVDYEFPLFPNSNQKAQCVICLEDNPPFNFCPPHAPFHLKCLAQNLSKDIEKWEEGSDPSFITRNWHDQFDRYLYSSWEVAIKASDSIFPSCPVCKKHSENHYLDAQYFDQDTSKGHVKTTLEWIRDSDNTSVKFTNFDALWARLGAIYSTFQAGLAIMHQRHHDIADKIALLKKVSLLFDVGTIAHHYWQLYNLLYEKYVVTKAKNDTPQERAKKAASALEAERLEHNRLTDAIETAVSEGKILKIWDGNVIPLSEAGRVICQELKDAVENKDLLEENDTVVPQTPVGEGVLKKFKEALETGEIIRVNGFIPLSLESIPIIKQLVTCLAKKKITQDNPDINRIAFTATSPEAKHVMAALRDAFSKHEVAPITKYFLPLSSNGWLKMERYLKALSDDDIYGDEEEDIQFSNQASETIYNEFLQAIDDVEILYLKSEEELIPITPDAKVLFKHALACEKRLEKAYNEDEEAKQEVIDKHSALQKKYYNNFRLAMVAGGAILAAGSALIVHLFNKKLYSAVNLTEVLKKVASPDDLKNMEISWEVVVHWMPYLSQCLVAHRIFLNLILTVFSPNKSTHALSALMQGITFWTIPSSDLLIHLTRTYTYPVKFIKSLTSRWEIQLPLFPLMGCSSLASHLESHIKSIYDYTTHLFEGSSWEEYFRYRGGVNVGGKIVGGQYIGRLFDVTLQTPSLASCGCKLAAVIKWPYFKSVTHEQHGNVDIRTRSFK